MSVFNDSKMFELLWILPPLVMVMLYGYVVKRKAMRAFLGVTRDSVSMGTKRRRICLFDGILVCVVFVLIVCALARPVWDTEIIVQPPQGRDIVFVIDVSQSMLAKDQPPNRLECAKNSVLHCLDNIGNGRIALVAFAGATSIKCPLTRDCSFFKTALADLNPESVVLGGTRIGDAIRKTTEKILSDEDAASRDIVIITDGEDHDSKPEEAFKDLIDTGARFIIIGIGDDRIGSKISIDQDTGAKSHVKSKITIVTKQNSGGLAQLAQQSDNGFYINVGTNPMDLAAIYKHFTDSVKRHAPLREVESPVEQYWRFLLMAIVLAILRLFPLVGEKRLNFRGVSNLSNRKGRVVALILAFVLFVSLAGSVFAESAGKSFKEGCNAYTSEQYEKAAESFQKSVERKPTAEGFYNLGAALYRKGDMAGAVNAFTESTQLIASDNNLEVNASYNRANALYKMAMNSDGMTKDEGLNLLDMSILSYEHALKTNPEHHDSLYNMRRVRKMRELMAAQKQSKEGQKGDSSSDSDSKDADNQESKSSDESNHGNPHDIDNEEERPPNMTSEDILKEEQRNNLKRSRKTHADFGKVKENW